MKFPAIISRTLLAWALLVSLRATAGLDTPKPIAKSKLYAFTSTGDVRYDNRWQPLDSPATVTAWFERMASLGVKRVYWRGEQDLDVVKYGRLREEDPIRYEHWNSWQRHLNIDLKLNDIAVKEAHSRGIEIYLIQSMLDFGASPDIGYTRYPYAFEDKLRTDFPDWTPVDRTGRRHQAGPIEFCYPDARKKYVDRLVAEANQRGYDGVQLYTYFENFGTRFQTEFGYNDPIVAEYRKRYGKDIRETDPDIQKWSDLRGEYVSTFLDELHTGLAATNRKLSVCLSPNNPSSMQEWPLNSGHVNMAMTMDWPTWVSNGTVDEIGIMGGGDEKSLEFARNILKFQHVKPLEVTIFSERPVYHPFDEYLSKGLTVTVWSAPFPTQPMERATWDVPTAAALTSDDWKQRAQALAEAEIASLKLDVAQILPLVKDPHPLVRRQALNTLTHMKATEGKHSAEDALNDPEESVRTSAVRLLGKVGNADSVDLIFQSISARPSWMVNEAAVTSVKGMASTAKSVLIRYSKSMSETARQVAIRSMANLPDAEVQARLREIMKTDASKIVRYHAIIAIGQLPSVPVMDELNAALNDPEAMVRCAAAARITELARIMSVGQRAVAVASLTKIYKTYGDGSKVAEADWGYRPVGAALIALGVDGRSALESMYAQTLDKTLAFKAYLSLHVPMSGSGYVSVTPELSKIADKLVPAK